jgi:hypothetical protein
MHKLVPILDFAYRIGFKNLYDWQAKVLKIGFGLALSSHAAGTSNLRWLPVMVA